MKHKIPRLAAHFPAFWPILTVYLLEFGVLGPGQCYLILRQLSMWVPAVLGMMLMRLSGSYNMAVGTQMTFSAALLGILLQWYSVPMWAACVVVLAVAVVLGILYTVLSNRMQIPLFYLSLCVHLLLDGLNGFFYRMTRQTSNYAYAGADRTRWLGVPLWCWVALAALALGDPTAKSMHRLSLNPLHHIDWLGLALMFTVGFGWAKPVPVNPNYFRKPKQGMAVTALAGPVSNLLLAVLFLGIGKVIYLYAPYSEGMNVFFEWCLFTVAPMSVGMGLFNLIPIPPLDGSKVLAMFLPNSAYGQLMRYERYGILVLLALSWLGLGGNFLGNAIYGVYEALVHIFFA